MTRTAPAPGVYAELSDLIALQHQAKGFSFLPRQPIHSLLAGRHASRLRGRGLNFEEIRRYFPGDDVRQIDWKATLRTRHTQLRVYTEERERSVLLLVDQRKTMFFGSKLKMKSVTAAETAALAAWRVLAQKDRIGAIVFNDAEILEVRPRRSRTAVMNILHDVVAQNHALSHQDETSANPGVLNQALSRAERLAKHDFLICLITDGHGQNDETNQIITRISRHNDVLTAFIYDPLEKEIPSSGTLVVSDGAKQMAIDSDNADFRMTFRETFESNLERVRESLLQRKVPVIPLSTTARVTEQLTQYLGARLR